MSSLPSACHRMLYAAPQEGPQLLPEEHKPTRGLPQASSPTSLTNSLETSRDLCHIFTQQTDMSTKAFWSKGRKRKIQLAQAATWTDNFSWAQSPFGSQQLWPGQVQTYANHYPQVFSSEENFSNSFTFCSDDHACPLTMALRAEGKLCWRIKPQAPVGAPADQIILMEENCYEIFVLNHKWRNKKKTVCKDHLLFKAFFPGKVREAAPPTLIQAKRIIKTFLRAILFCLFNRESFSCSAGHFFSWHLKDILPFVKDTHTKVHKINVK